MIRYYLSAVSLDFALWVLPDDYTRSRLQWGIGLAGDLMMKELEAAEDEMEESENETIH